jgi:hypothetical protein
MFQQFAVKPSLGVWKAFFCEGDFGRCERLKKFTAGNAVPPGLLPNGRMLDVPLDQIAPRHFK